MSLSATCDGCGEGFEARHRNARWCSDRCRKASARKAEKAVQPGHIEDLDESPTGLVAAVTSELEAAKVIHTFAGQLAVSLAKRLASPDETGASSLSKELRTVMAAALAGVTPPAATEDDDEVAKARVAREHKAREAARRA
jgi:hypothetical protein